ncbi:tail tape measure protein [Sandaracinobacteroides sp. A072]|uniref:tail tape measure protein n=1 Tax=Sandaracinobacteroides sp. A072 TaxID=3461146 RepID=UPI004041C4EA
MVEDFEGLALRVRTDSDGFVREVGEMRRVLAEGLSSGADAAARGVETALRRAARSGRIEFEDLARAGARALGELAAAALKLDAGGGLAGAGRILAGASAAVSGLPGRATGGPVSPGRAYVVGERGPELFVPTMSGRVEAGGSSRGPVTVNVHVAAPREGAAGAAFMAQTGRQVARDVRRALSRWEG